MSEPVDPNPEKGLAFCSSTKSDVWHPGKGPAGYEWWYFDALSDDERDAVVIIFLDNFIFSPRYNALNRTASKNGRDLRGVDVRFPAVAFFYYRDGKPLYRSITEFSKDQFSADPEWPYCRIGNSSLRFDSAPYGSGYDLQIDVKLRNGFLRGQFEWLSIESDLDPADFGSSSNAHYWNLVSPRSDVTGKFTVSDRSGRELRDIHFRGTGYHDHNLDRRWLPESVAEWNWGRAHFTDVTAVLYDYRGAGDTNKTSKLYLIRDKEIAVRDVVIEEQEYGRDRFGLRYPKRLRIETDRNEKLRIKQTDVIDSSFFYTRFINESILTLRDGIPRKTTGIAEYLAPSSLKNSWLDWLVDMRIGKEGRTALLS